MTADHKPRPPAEGASSTGAPAAGEGHYRPVTDAPPPEPGEARRANLALWNEWTKIHETSRFYDVAGFKAGSSALRPLERDELGEVAGKKLLHLQCHFGLDTLSWARLGATVTGVDFSGEAIALARRLADEVGLSGRAGFLQSDILELTDVPGGPFDIVFVSYGALCWLPDLTRWATVVTRNLRPGGVLYMAEVHPFADLLEETPDHDVRIEYPYFPAGEPLRFAVEGSYADPDAHVEQDVCYSWVHSFSEILGALTEAGLRLEYLHEFPYSVSPFWRWMERGDDGWYRLPDGKGGTRRDVPFLYSLKAHKPAGDGETGRRGAAGDGETGRRGAAGDGEAR